MLRIKEENLLKIKGNSLQPLIKNGQYVEKVKISSYSDIAVNDIILFTAAGKILIKTVFAIENDEIFANDQGRLFVNSEEFKTLYNTSFNLSEEQISVINNCGIVPEESFMVVGNSSIGTEDSTKFGPVSFENVFCKINYRRKIANQQVDPSKNESFVSGVVTVTQLDSISRAKAEHELNKMRTMLVENFENEKRDILNKFNQEIENYKNEILEKERLLKDQIENMSFDKDILEYKKTIEDLERKNLEKDNKIKELSLLVDPLEGELNLKIQQHEKLIKDFEQWRDDQMSS